MDDLPNKYLEAAARLNEIVEKNNSVLEKIDRWRELYDVLKEDVIMCSLPLYDENGDLIQSTHTQLFRRMLVRALISSLEGIMFSAKELAKTIAVFSDVNFTDAEMMFLNEEKYNLDDKGEIKAGAALLRIIPNFRFTIKMFSKSCCAPAIQFDKDQAKWLAFRETVEIRNRITHPRKIEDLTITDEELRKIEQGAALFMSVMVEMFENTEYARKKIEKERDEFLKELNIDQE